MDAFPEDQARLTRQIQRDIVQAQASAGKSRPLLEASAGWIFTDRATPPTPPAGKTHIYSQGGRLWAASTAGAVPLLLPDPFPVVGNVGDVVNAAPGATYGDTERALLGELKLTVNALLANMRASTIMQ